MKTNTKKITARPLPGITARPALLLLTLVGGAILSSAQAQLPTLVVSNKWSLNVGSHWDIDAGNLTRGVAINPVTGNVLLASRVSSNHVSIISGVDGSDLGTLQTPSGVVAGGTIPCNLVRAADDGAVYLLNLSANNTSVLKLYRWNSESDGQTNDPIVAANLSPAPVTRYGDTMDIRGGGTNTQILVSGSASTTFGIFTTTDGTNFTLTEFNHGQGAGALSKGITFEGTNDVIYGKNNGSGTIRKLSFNLVAATAALVTNITVTPDNDTVGIKYYQSNGVQFLSAVLTANATATNATTHRMKVYTINNPASPSTSADFPSPQPYTANGNVVGSSDIHGNLIVGIDVNSGVSAFTYSFATNVAPSITTQPQDQTNTLTGGYVTFAVSANGTGPLRYQWRHDNVAVSGATNALLNLTNLVAADAGLYTVVITNVAGSVTSSPAQLGLLPSTITKAAERLWTKAAGDLFFLANDNTSRGLGYNPTTGHLIVVSRSPSNGVHVVNATTGAYISSLDMSGVTGGGTFVVNLVGVGDDGAIYVANLDTGGINYQIYRWADENPLTVASSAYGPGDPCGCGRVGDTFAIRGGGTNTQILIGSRDGTQVVLFNTSDGVSFSPNVIDTAPEPAGLAGLGIAFGAGDTFWTKSSGVQFRHFVFDLPNGTNGLLQTFAAGQTTSVALAVDPVNDLLAGIVPNTAPVTSRPLPDHVDLYDVHGLINGAVSEPSLIDEDFFQTAIANGNGTASAVFDLPGGRLFALDTNNGLLALKVVARLFQTTSNGKSIYQWTGPSVLQSSTNVASGYLDLAGATSPYTNNNASAALFFRLKR